MNIATKDIYQILEYATLAPSVHNLQPWQVHISGEELILSLAQTRIPTESDPTHRQSWISLGCFAENLLIAASNFNITCSLELTKQETVILKLSHRDTRVDPINLETLRKRHTERHVYVPAKIDSEQIKLLENEAGGETEIRIVTDGPTIQRTAELLRNASAMALSLGGFRKEISASITPIWQHKKTGIAASSLGVGKLSQIIKPLQYRYGKVAKKESQAEYSKILSSSGLVFVLTPGDIWHDWFMAGRSYERAVLRLTQLGFAQATTAALVEAPDFHLEIEQTLKTKCRLQAVVRFGQSNSNSTWSSRLAVEDILH